MTLRRILTLAVAGLCGVVIPSLIASAPAGAQTYGDRNFPFCLRSYAPIQYIECRYASFAQCHETASGRAAMCVQNPYFSPRAPLGARLRIGPGW